MVRLEFTIPLLLLVSFSLVPVMADSGSFTVVSGKSFQVNYNSDGVKIEDVQPNPMYDEILLFVKVSKADSTLDISLPRELIDSKQNSKDVPFIIVVDGVLASATEKNTNPETRTVSLNLTPENQEIEIIGTTLASSTSTNTQTNITATQKQQTTQIPNQTAAPTQPSVQNLSKPMSQKKEQKIQSNLTEQKQQVASNETQDFLSKMPFLSNSVSGMIKGLSITDYAVIGSIALVILIVIASVARRRPNRITR